MVVSFRVFVLTRRRRSVAMLNGEFGRLHMRETDESNASRLLCDLVHEDARLADRTECAEILFELSQRPAVRDPGDVQIGVSGQTDGRAADERGAGVRRRRPLLWRRVLRLMLMRRLRM